jgi:hypothetical protein
MQKQMVFIENIHSRCKQTKNGRERIKRNWKLKKNGVYGEHKQQVQVDKKWKRKEWNVAESWNMGLENRGFPLKLDFQIQPLQNQIPNFSLVVGTQMWMIHPIK